MSDVEEEGDGPPSIADAPYEVGNKKPPRYRQFQPGTSGNPAGRPRGSESLSKRIERELRKMTPVSKAGKPVKMTKMDVIAVQIVDLSMKGNLKATHLVLRNNQQETVAQATASNASGEFTLPDKEGLKFILKRISRLTEDE